MYAADIKSNQPFHDKTIGKVSWCLGNGDFLHFSYTPKNRLNLGECSFCKLSIFHKDLYITL